MKNSKINQRAFIQISDRVENFKGLPPDIVTNTTISKWTQSKTHELNEVLLQCESFTGLKQILDLMSPLKDGVYNFPFPSPYSYEVPEKALITGWEDRCAKIGLGACSRIYIEADAEGVVESRAQFSGSLGEVCELPDVPFPLECDQIMLFNNSILEIDGIQKYDCFAGFRLVLALANNMGDSSLDLTLDRMDTEKNPHLLLGNKHLIKITINSSDNTYKFKLRIEKASSNFNHGLDGYNNVTTRFKMVKVSLALSGVGDE